jgi:hypothetical protein
MRGVTSNPSRRQDSSVSLALTVFGGGGGLVAILVGCGWFLLHDDLAARVDPAITARLKAGAPILTAAASQPRAPAGDEAPAADEAPSGMTLASTTSTPVDLPPRKPAPAAVGASAAMLDVTSSLGIAPAAFSKVAPGSLEEHFTRPVPPERPKTAQAVAPVKQEAAPPSPAPVRVAALGVPLPAPRPNLVSPSLGTPVADTPPAKPPTKPAARKPTEKHGSGKSAEKPANGKGDTTTAKTVFEKLFGKPEAPEGALAYAPTDGGIQSDAQTTPSGTLKLTPPFDKYTAVYDISAAKVYMPDGTVLEAHSGRGPMFDNPKYANQRMRGPTPPHIYNLREREAIFYGVRAIRLLPVGGEKAIFGRNGLLAHTYLYGPRGESFGCVSFKDYAAFLRAFDKGQVKRLAVLDKVE